MPRPVLTIKEPYTPEMLPEAVAAIEGLLDKDSEVFEFGGGYSTLWFAERVKRVVWVEHDEAWHEETDRALREIQKVNKSKAILVDSQDDIAGAIENYGEFDLVLVDCLDRQRMNAVKAAIDHVKPGGWLVLDDSQWPMLSEAKGLLVSLGWEATVYAGSHTRKNGDVKPHATTIYQRPALKQAQEPDEPEEEEPEEEEPEDYDL